MSLTPLDIHNKEFRRSLRGYSETEVDEFLDQVVREFERLLKDNATLKDQVELMSSRVEQYRQMEDTLHKTLIVAQESADELKSSARKEAEAIVKQAQLEAEKTRHEVDRELEEARSRLKNLSSEFMKLKSQFKGALQAQIELLDQSGHLGTVRLSEVEWDSGENRQTEPTTYGSTGDGHASAGDSEQG